MTKASAVEALLFAALEKPTAAERDAFLDSACGGDAELRRQVERLLQAEANVGSFLQKPAVGHLAPAPEPLDATQAIDVSTDGPVAAAADGTWLTLARTEGEGASAEGDSLDFLQPPRRPDSLGRLGHYEVLEVLGRGGFGIVFRAFDEQLQRVVAIKVLAPDMAATSPARKRFLREARASARVRHENVVQVYAVEEEPLPYLVMEFVPGETLQQRLDRTGPLEVTEVAQVGRQLAEGLAAAHDQGLIHRDIKPGNILIEAGPNPHLKITDFGLARAADDASLTQSGVVAGTPMFMAPEQASAGRLDHRADLFSLGSVLYVMCCGRPPFRAPSTLAVLKRVVEDTPRPIREIIPEVPEWLCDLISRLHAKRPEDRIGTAREVADLLGQGLAALLSPGSVKPPSFGPREVRKAVSSQQMTEVVPVIKPRSRSRRWVAAAAVLLVLGGALSFTEATGVTHVRGTVIRLFSPEGTLEIQVDDPGVSVQIDGSDIVITGAGVKEICLRPGSYTVKASKDGKVVKRELVTVTKDGRQVVRVGQVARPVATEKDDNKGSGSPTNDPDRRAAEYVRSLGGRVTINEQTTWFEAAELPREPFRLTRVSLRDNKRVSDVGLTHFKGCKNLSYLILENTSVSDVGLARFKDCKNLTFLVLSGTHVTDAGLAYFKDRDLTSLYLSRTKVTDAGLARFKDCKNLGELILRNMQMTDAGLAHFKNARRLYRVHINGTRITDAGLAQLKECKNLGDLWVQKTNVTAAGIDALKEALPKCQISWDGGVIRPRAGFAPYPDAEVKRIAALPTAAQVEEVRKAIQRRNPAFRGTLIPTIKDGVVTGLTSQGRNAAIEDISPLRWMKLTSLILTNHSQVTDLTPLRGMPLEHLSLWPFLGSDLTPLQGMPLKVLNIGGGGQKLDLTPLAGLPLEYLCVNFSQVSDLTPLKDMPLKHLEFTNTKVTDFAPLRSIKTLQTINKMPAAKFWKKVVPPAGVLKPEKSRP